MGHFFNTHMHRFMFVAMFLFGFLFIAGQAETTYAQSTTLSCGGSNIEFFCTARTYGGSGNYSYTWNYNSVANVIFADDYGSTLELILSSCNPNRYNTVSVTVTDNVTGQTSSAWTNLPCSSGGGGV